MTPIDFEQLFKQINRLEGLTPDDFTIERLPGYTNQNFRLHNQYDDCVLRIPRPETDRFIDRDAEAFNQSLAHGLGLAPQVCWRNTQGMTLTPTLKASRGIRATDFNSDELLQAILQPIQRLHRSEQQFHGRVNLGELITRHFELLSDCQQSRLLPRVQQARRLLALLENSDTDYVASHNDLVLENLLLEDQRLWLIDWEYSAMASPYWDLATLCNAANLDLNQSRHLLRVYCVGGSQMEESILFDYRGLLNLLSEIWMAALAD